jgi:phage terminase large subunit-like protein
MSSIDHWRSDPVKFIETVLYDPETGKPFKLLPAEKAFLAHAFELDADGRLRYPEQVFGAPKKSGKTAFAALMTLTMLLLFGGMYGEAYACANDEEQAASRVFQAIRRIVERSPLLKPVAKITADKISFPTFRETTTPRSPTATPAPREPTLWYRPSMNYGATRRRRRAGCGMRWCRHRRARLPAG